MQRRRKPSWADLRQKIKLCDRPELLGLLKELHDLSPENRLFLQARLLLDASTVDAKEEYRGKIIKACYLKSGFPRAEVELAKARASIRHYRTATQDIKGTVDLMLTYLEVGTTFVVQFGETDEGFCRSLGSVMEETGQILKEYRAAGLYGQFRDRMQTPALQAANVGWGHADHIADMVASLEQEA